MKRAYRWVIVCVCTAVVGGVAGFAVRLCTDAIPWRLKAKWASELDPADPGYQKVMCGPASLSVALGRLGVSISPAEIASNCTVTSYGVALADLERVTAKIRPITATARKLTWEELRPVDGVAILFVKGGHYVAVDPRETSPKTAKATAIRVYDRDVPARWYSRIELEQIWSGETLIIMRRQTSSNIPAGARIAWNECYIDAGILKDTAIAGFQFVFRNEGSKDLFIEGIQKSCGCMKYTLSTEQLAPGESAQIEVDVNLDGREGFVQQYMIVKSSDPASPVSYLGMACAVPRKRPVSSQGIRLEDLPQGGNVRQDFVVADSRFAGIEILDARFLLCGRSGSPSDVSCSISWEMIGDDAKTVSERTGFSTSRGDRLVRLAFHAENACPVGPFEGHVAVTVRGGDSVATHKVEIQGMIVQDVHSVPQIALITLGPDPESIGNATIRLQSRANRKITVVKAWSDGTRSLEITPESGLQADKNNYVVAARMPDLVVGSAPFNGTAMFELDSGSVVSVPVTVFRPPQGRERAPGAMLPVESGKD